MNRHPEHIEADLRANRENRMDILEAIGVITKGKVDSVHVDDKGNAAVHETIQVVKVPEIIEITCTLDTEQSRTIVEGE